MNRPQDRRGAGTGLTFETLEHGGAYPDMLPQAIRVTNAEGADGSHARCARDRGG